VNAAARVRYGRTLSLTKEECVVALNRLLLDPLKSISVDFVITLFFHMNEVEIVIV
jgi:hypothetical protein